MTHAIAKVSPKLPLVLIACAALSLGACGETRGERFLTGAALGAGTGMLGTAVFGGEALTGAIVGGSVGGVAGGLSERSWWQGKTWNPRTWY